MRRLSAISVLLAAMLFVMSATAVRAADAKAAKDTPSVPSILDNIVPTNEAYNGITYEELIGQWLQWYVNLPLEPWTVKAPGIWAKNQAGTVWFLAGVGSYDAPLRRSVKIPQNTAIFFPIINSSYIGWPQSPYNETPDIGWGLTIPRMDTVDELQCTIDGVEVPNLFDFRVDSGGYPDWSGVIYNAPEGWQFDDPNMPADIYPGLYPYTSNGYWLLLEPLAAGKHTIQIRAKSEDGLYPGFSIDVTYDVTVGK